MNEQPGYWISEEGLIISPWGKIIQPFTEQAGYERVMIGRKKQSVSRLIAKYFIPNPDNLPIVDHINRIRNDNRIENLQWVTRKQNCLNRIRKGCLTWVSTKGYWEVCVCYNGQRFGLKRFFYKENKEVARNYLIKITKILQQLNDEYAQLNTSIPSGVIKTRLM